MLSSVLRSPKAIKVNIHIMRVFTKMREMLMTHKDLLLNFDRIESVQLDQSDEIELLFKYVKRLINQSEQKKEQAERKQIGFKK